MKADLWDEKKETLSKVAIDRNMKTVFRLSPTIRRNSLKSCLDESAGRELEFKFWSL